MNYLVIIVFTSIIGIGMAGIFSIINHGQELSEINNTVQLKNTEIAVETLSIKGEIVDGNTDGTITLSNLSNQEIRVIQIRVYGDDGEFVKSFDIDYMINGNVQLTILPENLPAELQGMLVQ